MKTKEELKELKENYEAINKKLAELSADELLQVTGGAGWLDGFTTSSDDELCCTYCGKCFPTSEKRDEHEKICPKNGGAQSFLIKY